MCAMEASFSVIETNFLDVNVDVKIILLSSQGEMIAYFYILTQFVYNLIFSFKLRNPPRWMMRNTYAKTCWECYDSKHENCSVAVLSSEERIETID